MSIPGKWRSSNLYFVHHSNFQSKSIIMMSIKDVARHCNLFSGVTKTKIIRKLWILWLQDMRNEEVEKKNSYETDIHVPVAHTRSQILFVFFFTLSSCRDIFLKLKRICCVDGECDFDQVKRTDDYYENNDDTPHTKSTISGSAPRCWLLVSVE